MKQRISPAEGTSCIVMEGSWAYLRSKSKRFIGFYVLFCLSLVF